MIGLDTNVLLRLLIDEKVWPSEQDQARAARKLVVGSRESFFVNQVVLAETVWVLENPMAQAPEVVRDIVERLLASANVVVDRREAAEAALAGFRAGKPGFADHLIGHLNRLAGCETTMTFDKDAGRTGLFRRLTF